MAFSLGLGQANNLLNFLLAVGAIMVLLSIFGAKFFTKIGVPMLLFFIAVGVFSRYAWEVQEVLDDATLAFWRNLAKNIGVITLTFILFLGGLSTNIKHVTPVIQSGTSLSTLGSLLTAILVGGFLYFSNINKELFPTFDIGLLVGVIVSSTDAAAVFSILRSRKIKLKRNLDHLLELESGSNDVMVCFLMYFLFRRIKENELSFLYALPSFVGEMAIGSIGGLITGYILLLVINKIKLPQAGLYPLFTLAMIFLGYGLVSLLHGSGYLAVYIAGMVLGSRDFIHRKSIMKFYEGFSWILEISMFIGLGCLVNLEILLKIAGVGIALSFVLMFFARPISVWASLAFSNFKRKDKGFIAWVGLRGAVPIVFATYFYSGLDETPFAGLADQLFHLIFFVVITSILIQGSTLYWMAKRMGLIATKKKYKNQVLELSEEVKKILVQLEIPGGSPAHQQKIVDLGLPEGTVIVLVHRNQRYFPPKGGTELEAHDKLFIAVNTKKELKKVQACLGIIL
ncbi:MAG: potassium/proton antiporter [Cytophagales bacterium]